MTAIDVGITFYSLFSIINAVESPMALNSALLELFIELTYNVILFNIGVIPVVGWLISLGLVLSDVFGGWTNDLFEWIVSIMSRVKASVEPKVMFADEPSISIDDKDSNGLDVGDRISYTHSVIGRIEGFDWSLVSHSGIYPYVTLNGPSGSYSNVGQYYSTEWVFQARDLGMTGNDVHLWLPIPPKSSWIRSSNSSSFLKWDAQQYEVGGWIEPGIGMPNFPVTINMDAVYTLDYKWEHFVFLVFYGFWCEHLDYNKGIQSLGSQTIFFDVMPANIDDFISWRGITPLDHDGDGLRDSQESLSDAWKYDTDADGLNDKFELDIGTNPILFDTDFDGLLDGFELIYDVDPNDADTDGDGLPDYLEEAGWLIAFNYTGQPSLSFTMHVTSDPKIKDTDSDGIDDLTEYWSILNPRSVDTDADGLKDIPKQGSLTNYVLDDKLDFSGPYDPWMWLDDLDVFSNGTVLVLDRRDGQILSCNLDEMAINPWNYDTTKVSSPTRITIDEENQYIHIADSGSIKTFDFNGVWIKTWGEGGVILALEFDNDGYAYILRGDSSYATRGWINKYNNNGTLMASWNSYGPDNSTELYGVQDIAVDRKNGFLYVSDARRPWEGGHRIVTFGLEGNWETTRLWGSNDYPNLLTVDKDGFLYVLDSTHSVYKFDSNGMLGTSWPYNATGEWHDAFDVDIDKNVYVASVAAPDYTFYSIQKFSPQNLLHVVNDTVPDRDGDGLENDEETSGWTVTFTNETGTFSVLVTSDPMLNDTDTDGLTDYQENILGTNPRDPDTDDDGLNDYVEWKGFPSQTNPINWDTDGDGLADGIESTYGSNPLKGDSDGEGLSDFIEFYLNSDSNNPDTDRDGLDDSTEVTFNSSPNSPDSDGDLMFDGREFTEGTNPQNSDSDNDGIFDGNEVFLGTSPLNKDTDGDNVTDGIEVLLWMNPLSNDTDQDGLLDSTELERGTNPFNEDSDGDGIRDSEDEDSYSSHVEEIILTFDSSNQTSEFADNLAQYTNVTTVAVNDLLLNYKDKPYIVIVGDPEGNGTVGQLVASLLADCGDVLTGMIESDVNRLAVRHGVWNETQTVVLLSKPFPNDHYRVLDILKGKIVTIQPDSATVEFIQSTLVEAPDGGSLNHTALSYTFFKIDEIDTVKQTDSTISAVLDEAANATVQISRYNNSSTPFSLTHESGLATNEKAVGKYLELNVSENVQNKTSDILSEVYVEFYYRLSDLDTNGDGDTTDIEDLREESLTLYFFNETSQTWTKATEGQDWVISIGVNTKKVEIYGESYEGYVWAYLTHFSLYGLAGMSNNNPPDVSNAYPSIQYLWPPNNKFIDVTIEGVSDPDNDTITITILTITSNESTNSHEPDSYGVGTSTASLRAERLGSGDGRVYKITFLASDGNGGETTGTVNVYVQHNNSEKNYENKQTENDDNQTSNYDEQPPVIEENKTPELNDVTPSDNTKTKKDKQAAKTKKHK
ncbi:MAG: hypothetical protein CW691_01510 [Candidatus Bathyarchaeum sp.]|nr:MAG: hypothetical protein CW691_01510 [Candidatus Bathyarchaeum sp.]